MVSPQLYSNVVNIFKTLDLYKHLQSTLWLKQAVKITQVSPYSIKIETFGMESFSYPISSKFSISQSGLDIKVYDVVSHGSMSKIHLKIGKIVFKVLV